jgi:asparagine synthetase B (glutamine-hydrolysing)
VDVDGWRQPLTNEDAAIFVVYSKKIYNHQNLKVSLEDPLVDTNYAGSCANSFAR